MSEYDDGEPAFPQSETLMEDGAVLVKTSHGGMSLRDWFAGQAVAHTIGGLLANGVSTEKGDASAFAEAAYRLADAMLAARNSTPTKGA